MSVWLEIHCDKKSAGPPDPSRNRPFCYSESNVYFGLMTGNTKADLAAGMRNLSGIAREGGWVCRHGEWLCPNCKTVTP